jgi:hypothetical protein
MLGDCVCRDPRKGAQVGTPSAHLPSPLGTEGVSFSHCALEGAPVKLKLYDQQFERN